MNKQPEALRLADELENGECFDVGACGVAYGWMHNDPTSESADELRRLHADNERLREEGTKFHDNITFIGHFPGSESVEVMRLTRNGIWANPDVEIDNTAKIVLAALEVQLKALAQEAVKAEREACAKVAEEATSAWTEYEFNRGCMYCAKAIRARGEV